MKKWAWPLAREPPKYLGFPFNIYTMAEATIFKFGIQLVFDKAHHKMPYRRKSGHGRWLEELPKNLGFPFNICATAETSNFNFGMQLGFTKAHHKTTPRGKVGVALG